MKGTDNRMFRGKYFNKMLIIIGGSVLILVLCLTSILYFTSANQQNKQMIKLNLEIVNQIKDNVDKELQHILNGISEVIVNQEVIQAIYSKQLENDFEKIVPLNQQLINVAMILENVHSVDLYLPASQILISSVDGAKSINNISSQKKEIYQSVQSIRRPYWTFNSPSETTNVLSYFQPLPVGANFPQAYFSIHMHDALISNILNEAHFSEQSDYYILRRDGRIILHNDRDKVGVEAPFSSDIHTEMLSGSQVGYFDHKSEKEMLFYGRMQNNDWILVYAVPYAALNTAKNELRLNTFIITGIALLVVGFITYVIVNYLHFPLRSRLKKEYIPKDHLFFQEWEVFDEMRKDTNEKVIRLTESVEKNQQQLSEAFFTKWLLGSQEENLFQHASSSVFLQPIKHSYPVVLVLDIEKFKSQKPLGSSMFLDLKRIGMGVCQQYNLRIICVPIEDARQFAFILPFFENLNETGEQDQLTDIVKRVHQSVQEELQLQFSIGIGTMKENDQDVKFSYHEALEALNFRLTKGDNQIISYEELLYTDPLQYPYTIEEKIINELKNGDKEAYLMYFDQFVEEIQRQNCAPESIYHAFSMLYTTLFRTLDENHAMDTFTLNKFHQSLQSITTMREMKRWFKKDILLEFLEKADQLSENRSSQLIKGIMDYLHEHVTQPHTLTSIAEHFDLNASYLSRVFKQSTGKSFVQYMSEIKIKVAQQKLLETNMSIAEIAEYVGYTERTFGRVFKKVTNNTPANYRKMHK